MVVIGKGHFLKILQSMFLKLFKVFLNNIPFILTIFILHFKN